MEIEIIKSRRKSIVLKMCDSSHAVLKVPYNYSSKRIKQFLEGKLNWLEKVSSQIKQNEEFKEKFNFNKYIYINGEILMQTSQICPDFESLQEQKKLRIIKNFYKKQFGSLKEKVKVIASKNKLFYNSVTPITSKRVWGNFNTNKDMKLNWKLVILPERLSEYIICHELCHGLEMNHSPKFYQCVEKICPNYKVLKKELKSYGFLLKDF